MNKIKPSPTEPRSGGTKIKKKKKKMVHAALETLTGENKIKPRMAHAGLEPATFALLARRSNQLS